jgi:hypothetical protein
MNTKTRNAISNFSLDILRRLVKPTSLPFQNICVVESFDMPPSSDESEPLDLTSLFPERLKTDCRIPKQERKYPYLISHMTREPTRIESDYLVNKNDIPHTPHQQPSSKQIIRPSASALKLKSLDAILENDNSIGTIVYNSLASSTGESYCDKESLKFDSRFESGNLHLAIKLSPSHYELYIKTDVNAPLGRHNQWFYFSISNFQRDRPYQFTIVNAAKQNSQLNFGMQPVYYSPQLGWSRIGENVSYFTNNYKKGGEPSSCYASATFTISFTAKEFEEDGICYLAYHYPYTYSNLLDSIAIFKKSRYMDCSVLCYTLSGLECHLLTITDRTEESTLLPIKDRPYVFVSARVHPGESNSSHIMHGLISYLLGDSDVSSALRKALIFKIVPFLNGDGVFFGNHRTSLCGQDLNRRWADPSREHTPTIYWAKELLRSILKTTLLALDIHGHSRKKNVFAYGNDVPGQSTDVNSLPSIFATICNDFDFEACNWSNDEAKSGTARSVFYHDLGIESSYTIESSYNGSSIGANKGRQFSIADLHDIGEKLGQTIGKCIL